MNPLILSYSDKAGGAARAARRLLYALRGSDVPTRMLVQKKVSDEYAIEAQLGKLSYYNVLMKSKLSKKIANFQRTSNKTVHTPLIFKSGLASKLNNSEFDVINLHWLAGEMISIEEIGCITKPIVWTLHDMWAFCGAEHYTGDSNTARWRKGYSKTNRLSGESGLDINRWVWNRKNSSWKKPMHIITPSRWLKKCVESSELMKDWPVAVIPNVLNVDLFKPWPREIAREIFGLPKSPILIAFGAMGGGSDPRKGWEFLRASLDKLRKQNVVVVVFGQSEPKIPPDLDLPFKWVGHIHDDETLALLYSAVDVMVVPSLQDNLPQTGTESIACGTPVVAFNCSGLPDVVQHKKTGYLAEPYSVEDLANGINWVVEDISRWRQLSFAARDYAVSHWSPSVVVPQYLDVYDKARGDSL